MCQKLCFNFIIIQMIILCLFLSWSKRHWSAHFCATVAKSSFQVNFLILPIDNKSPIFMALLPHLQSGHILVSILFENSLHKWPSFHSGFKKFKRRCKNDFFICLGFNTFKKKYNAFWNSVYITMFKANFLFFLAFVFYLETIGVC